MTNKSYFCEEIYQKMKFKLAGSCGNLVSKSPIKLLLITKCIGFLYKMAEQTIMSTLNSKYLIVSISLNGTSSHVVNILFQVHTCIAISVILVRYNYNYNLFNKTEPGLL